MALTESVGTLAVTIRSVNGAACTAIDAKNTSRCVYMGKAVVDGFTLKNGTAKYGGGAYYTTLKNCIVENCNASWGGGTYKCSLQSCTIRNNYATEYGGGAYGAQAENCIFEWNVCHHYGSASEGGGAARDTDFVNCVIRNNTSDDVGGGTIDGTLRNCLVIGNYAADEGGGCWRSVLYNCTVTENYAGSRGGGVSDPWENSVAYNSIIWGNITDGYSPNVWETPCYNCYTEDPFFVDAANGNYRLQSNSPCINAGAYREESGATDLDGNLRNRGVVDIGAYEYGTMVSVNVATPDSAYVTNVVFGLYSVFRAPDDAVDPLCKTQHQFYCRIDSGELTNQVVLCITNKGVCVNWDVPVTNYMLKVAAEGHGAIDCSNGWCAANSSFSVAATPEEHYHFLRLRA